MRPWVQTARAEVQHGEIDKAHGSPNGEKDAHAKLGEYCQPHAAAAGRQSALRNRALRSARGPAALGCSQRMLLELVQASC